MLNMGRWFANHSLSIFGLLAMSHTGFAQTPGAAGLWLDNEGRAAIEIDRCDRSFCGRIVWLKEPNDTAGQPWVDLLNPLPSMRSTPICGLQIIGELKREVDGSFTGGWIYDPEQGKRFNVEIMPKSADIIEVLAYDKDKVLSETMAWTRLADTQSRCK